MCEGARCKLKYLIFFSTLQIKIFYLYPELKIRADGIIGTLGPGEGKSEQQFPMGKNVHTPIYKGEEIIITRPVDSTPRNPPVGPVSLVDYRLQLERYLTLPHPFAAIRDKDRPMTQSMFLEERQSCRLVSEAHAL